VLPKNLDDHLTVDVFATRNAASTLELCRLSLLLHAAILLKNSKATGETNANGIGGRPVERIQHQSAQHLTFLIQCRARQHLPILRSKFITATRNQAGYLHFNRWLCRQNYSNSGLRPN
jgi:hypothetical protein